MVIEDSGLCEKSPLFLIQSVKDNILEKLTQAKACRSFLLIHRR